MEYIHLVGTEQVQHAANTMRQAVDNMQRAASQIDDSLRRHQTHLDQWLSEFKNVVETLISWEHAR